MTKRMRVVTVGGGHGQAAMLRALLALDCEVTAVVSIADDGGCSGRLRAEYDMPPPGDLRRCLTTLACHRRLADRFEERFDDDEEDDLRRSAGNLALFDVYLERGSLAEAVRWAEDLLRCRGRVLPAADAPGRLTIYDRGRGVLEGETRIEREGHRPVVVGVHGPDAAFPEARSKIAEADLVLLGPGSFVTSTLATVMTGDLAEAIVTSRAERVLVQNLFQGQGATRGASSDDQIRLCRDHLCIGGGTDDFDLLVLADGPTHERQPLDDRTWLLRSPMAGRPMAGRLVEDAPGAGGGYHDPGLVADALRHHFGLELGEPCETVDDADAVRRFERRLAAARARLRERSSRRGASAVSRQGGSA